jgi:hypothetical protein
MVEQKSLGALDPDAVGLALVDSCIIALFVTMKN